MVHMCRVLTRRKEERLRRKEEERLRKEAEVRAWTSQVSQENKGIKDKNRYTSSLQSDAWGHDITIRELRLRYWVADVCGWDFFVIRSDMHKSSVEKHLVRDDCLDQDGKVRPQTVILHFHGHEGYRHHEDDSY